jgi:beta-glucosidase
MLKGSSDFLGLNHYTTHYASRQPAKEYTIRAEDGNGGIAADQKAHLSYNPDWSRTSMGWFIVPLGFRKLLNWIDQRYGSLPIYVTENGCSVAADSREEAVDDEARSDFITAYTDAMLSAIKEDGVDCRGYCAWSLMDNFEWCRGYDMRFGLVYTDFKTLERTPKASFKRYQQIINGYK